MNIDTVLQFTIDVTEDAGKRIMGGFRNEATSIEYKSRTNLVTSVDRESEDFIFSTIQDKYPSHTIIAEEGSRQDAPGEYVWYIDPIDGTNNFAHGIPHFCVSVGLFSRQDNRMVCGAVYNPCSGEMFSARKGGGAFMGSTPIMVSTTDDLGISILATGFPYDKENSETNNLREFNMFLPKLQGIRRMGSAALDLCYVACGRFDGYWEHSLSPWDIAAGAIIAMEAGATVTRYDGSPFDLEIPQLCVANGLIHPRMLNILASIHG